MAITVSLQCSEGRFELPMDVTASLRDVKVAFRKTYAQFADINMSAFALSYKGVFFADDSITLKAAAVEDGSILFMIRKRMIPSLNPQEQE